MFLRRHAAATDPPDAANRHAASGCGASRATRETSPATGKRRHACLWFCLAGALTSGCSPSADRQAGTPVPGSVESPPPGAAAVRFVDATSEAGIDYVLPSGTDSTYPMPAVMGGGAAVFDADGDGDLDLYFIAPASPGATQAPPAAGSSALGLGGNRFYRQREDGRFEDATAAAGLAGDGMGAAAGDLDNDGDIDLYLTRLGPDRLLINDGGGVFADRTAAWGAATPGWSSSAALLDYDRDGYLDVYVARYVAFDPARVCSQHGGRRDFCGPTEFEGLSDVLLHNRGGTGFEDVSAAAGIAAVEDAGLGVLAADFDHDGEIDIYVANDADPNNLWIHDGGGRFVDDGVLQGAAFNRWGNSEAGMGIAAGDADLDLDLDLFVTHLITETNTYYRNLMLPGFEDATIDTELGAASLDLTGFGAAFFDADNDGDLDLAVANGAVKRRPSALTAPGGAGAPPTFWSEYAEPNLLLVNEEGRFADASVQPPWTELALSRALVPADLDRDGDLDLVIANLDGAPRILRNLTIDTGAASDGPTAANWMRVRAFDPRLSREAIGARITVRTPDGPRLLHVLPPGSYLSAGPATAHLGLGAAEAIESFDVVWPDGLAESFDGAAANQVVELVRGEGRAR